VGKEAGTRICTAGDRPPLQDIAGEMGGAEGRKGGREEGSRPPGASNVDLDGDWICVGWPCSSSVVASRPQVLRAAGAEVVAEEAAAAPRV
jgi:hypothetical protein